MINKIKPSVDYDYWFKSLYTTISFVIIGILKDNKKYKKCIFCSIYDEEYIIIQPNTSQIISEIKDLLK